MRFLDSEKVFILVLHFLLVNSNRISRIINEFRTGQDPDDILIKFGRHCERIFKVLKNYCIPFDPKRNKKTNRNAVQKVIAKWYQTSSIANRKRTSYTTKLSQERIKFLCDFVRRRKRNRKLTLKQLKSLLKMPINPSTISRYLKKNDLKCYVQKKKPMLNGDHKKARLEFAKKYVNKPVEFWESVIFSDEKPMQNHISGRSYIRRGLGNTFN